VWLCSPETATASALRGEITDPRKLGEAPRNVPRLASKVVKESRHLLLAPDDSDEARKIALVKGPNIQSLPRFDELPDALALPVLLKVGDDISTDEILSAGANVLPFRSNIERISEFSFIGVDKTYAKRAKDAGPHAIVGGKNYGQGSSREHAALAPRYLGLRVVIARSFARIHFQNLVNFGVLPLRFADESDYERLQLNDELKFAKLRDALRSRELRAQVGGRELRLVHDLSERQLENVLRGGVLRPVEH
jgi:aconitate hydratase